MPKVEFEKTQIKTRANNIIVSVVNNIPLFTPDRDRIIDEMMNDNYQPALNAVRKQEEIYSKAIIKNSKINGGLIKKGNGSIDGLTELVTVWIQCSSVRILISGIIDEDLERAVNEVNSLFNFLGDQFNDIQSPLEFIEWLEEGISTQ